MNSCEITALNAVVLSPGTDSFSGAFPGYIFLRPSCISMFDSIAGPRVRKNFADTVFFGVGFHPNKLRLLQSFGVCHNHLKQP